MARAGTGRDTGDKHTRQKNQFQSEDARSTKPRCSSLRSERMRDRGVGGSVWASDWLRTWIGVCCCRRVGRDGEGGSDCLWARRYPNKRPSSKILSQLKGGKLVLLGCEKGREEGSRVGHAGGFEDAMVAGVARCSEPRADDQGQDSKLSAGTGSGGLKTLARDEEIYWVLEFACSPAMHDAQAPSWRRWRCLALLTICCL